MNEHYPFVLPPLPFSYSALEPYIDAKTMYIHHDRLLKTYIDNLNLILNRAPELQGFSLEQLILNVDLLPINIQTPIKNNAGGVFNHLFYFNCLTPTGFGHPSGLMAEYINWSFGSFDNFRKQFADAALSVFGSGYAWLTANANGMLRIVITPNQDTPLPMRLMPLLNLDAWEHAYFLKHYNDRADYIQDWYQVVNWEYVESNFERFLAD